MSPKPASRIYSVNDSKLISRAVYFHGQFVQDKATFIAYSPAVFKEDYHLIFKDMIDEGYAMPDDAFIRQEQARLTTKLNDIITEVIEVHSNIDYFLQIAFANDEHTLIQAGGSVLSKEKSHISNFIVKTHTVANLMVKSKAKLIEAGCKEQLITKLSTLATSILPAREAQEAYMTTRSLLTVNRVKHFNKIYEIMIEIHKAALKIWKNNPELSSRYDLPYPSPSDKEPDTVQAEIELLTQTKPIA